MQLKYVRTYICMNAKIYVYICAYIVCSSVPLPACLCLPCLIVCELGEKCFKMRAVPECQGNYMQLPFSLFLFLSAPILWHTICWLFRPPTYLPFGLHFMQA